MPDPACATSGLPPHTWDNALPHEGARQRADRVALAIEVCDTCPIAAACGALADTRRDIGVWGGRLRRWNPARIPHLGYDAA